jgi:poly-gamma-glutamate synthesis protein (capsule biosynthesis protein)
VTDYIISVIIFFVGNTFNDLRRHIMKLVKVLTIIAAIILVGVISAILIISNSDAYKDRQAFGEARPDSSVPESIDDGTLSNGQANEDLKPESDREDASEAPTPEEQPVIEVEPPELRFIAVGDIMLGRGVAYWIEKKRSYEAAFEKVKPYIEVGDVIFGNLESPITSSTKGLDPNRKIVLRAKPEAITALTSTGFNLLSLSNNHILDHYEKGLFDTMELLDQNGIVHAGGGKNLDEARKLAIIEKNGLKIGLLAYTDMAEITFAGDPYLSFAAGPEKSGVAPRKYEIIKEDIEKARGQVDLLAVSLHWGIEESFRITPEQVEFAHDLIDDGADIILGHHPHQFQGIEIYKGKPILYSLGNFIFDQNEHENQESFIVDMKYKGTELTTLTAIPIQTLEKSYVDIQTGTDAAAILKRQSKLSAELGTEPRTENDILIYK